MPICSYLVIPEAGAGPHLAPRLADLPGCTVARAKNRDVLLLVTDTQGVDEERDLRRRLEEVQGIRALILTFGEVDPRAVGPDPAGPRRRRSP